MVSYKGQLIAVGNNADTEQSEGTSASEMFAWASSDRVTWTRVGKFGGRAGTTSVTVTTLITAGDRIVAGGNVGGNWNGQEGARPALWISEDGGESWTQEDPNEGTDSYGGLYQVFDTPSGLVLFGFGEKGARTTWMQRDGHWTHTSQPDVSAQPQDAAQKFSAFVPFRDGFVSIAVEGANPVVYKVVDGNWTRVVPAGLADVSISPGTGSFVDLVVAGDHLVAVGYATRGDAYRLASTTALWSTTDGQQWQGLDDLGGVRAEDLSVVHATAPAGRSALIMASGSTRTDAQFCFQDVGTCRHSRMRLMTLGPDLKLVVSDLWVDAAPNLAPFYDRGDTIVDSGGIVVVSRLASGEGLVTFLRDDQPTGELPRDETPTPTTTTPAHPMLPPDKSSMNLRIGDVWRFEYVQENYGWRSNYAIGCELPAFNDREWMLVSSPPGPPFPSQWPIQESRLDDGKVLRTVFVNLTLVDPNRIELRVEGADTAWVFSPTDTPKHEYGCTMDRDGPLE